MPRLSAFDVNVYLPLLAMQMRASVIYARCDGRHEWDEYYRLFAFNREEPPRRRCRSPLPLLRRLLPAHIGRLRKRPRRRRIEAARPSRATLDAEENMRCLSASARIAQKQPLMMARRDEYLLIIAIMRELV